MSELMRGTYPINDANYINASQYEQPKEMFKTVFQRLNHLYNGKLIRMLDAGCASGAFLFHANNALNLSNCVGFDVADDLLAQARKHVPNFSFDNESLGSLPDRYAGQFDVCTCIGVLSIFDDIEMELADLIRCVRNGGHVLIVDLVNDEDVDVVMRYRKTSDDEPGEWLKGFNIRSKASYSSMLSRIEGVSSWDWQDFHMPFALPKSKDPLRAWTIPVMDRHQVVVGTGQLLNIKLLTISIDR